MSSQTVVYFGSEASLHKSSFLLNNVTFADYGILYFVSSIMIVILIIAIPIFYREDEFPFFHIQLLNT